MSSDDASSSAGGFQAKMSFASGNVAEQWRMFKRQLRYYFDSKYTKKQLTERKMIGVLMTALGREGVEIFDTLFDNPDDDSLKFDEVIEAFDDFCNPKKNTVFERSIYFNLRQKPSQSVDTFIIELKRQASLCEFAEDERENLIRDILVIGIRDAKLREELLRDPKLDLFAATQACKARERSQAEASQMDAIHNPDRLAVASLNRRSTPNVTPQQPKCDACGYHHGTVRPCPAAKGTCHKCRQTGHFSKMCRSRPLPRSVKAVEVASDASSEKPPPQPEPAEARADLLRIYGLQVHNINTTSASSQEETAWYVDLRLGSVSCRFKLDTAADCDTISETSLETLHPPPKLYPSEIVIKPYNAPQFRPIGKIVVPYQSVTLELHVTPAGEENLLGFKSCRRLQLIQRVSSLSQSLTREQFIALNDDLFKGEGRIPGETKIYTDATVCPSVVRPRRFAYALLDKLKSTLLTMNDQDIIERVSEPTEWVSNITLVEKADGSLRVCLDPQRLNKAIKIPKYTIPKPDDILVKLAHKKFFTVLDLKSGFWHLALDKESSRLMTFNSPLGRFCFKRLCFGINCAPEIFMAEMMRIFGDLDNVSPYFDDIIIATETEKEHDETLQRVCQRARDFNVRFNLQKLQYKQTSVQYLGLLITDKGMQPAQKHVRAVAEMPTPKDKAAVMRFLGLIKFLARFVPNVSSLSAALRNLTRKDVNFEWLPEHNREFEHLKNLIVAKPVLAFFDPNLPVTVQTDSSKDGLGSVLLQNNQPVAFASRALTPAEVRYSQIEKELLAIVFAVERFHEFVYGRLVTVHSDHRPLESILKKDMDKISARLQRLRLRLLKYNVDVHYLAGKHMLVADALSRAYLLDEPANLDYQSVTVHAVAALAVSPEKADWIASETKADPLLSVVTDWIRNDSWPQSQSSLAPGLKKFLAMRPSLSMSGELLFFENRLVVPAELQPYFVQKLHEGHLGAEKAKRLARESVFWHGMSKDIVSFTLACTTCQKFARNNPSEPLKPYHIPRYPWQVVAVDIATFGKQDFLVVVDKYSNWPEVVRLSSKSASEVILLLQNLFARHGIPETVISDNNPFNSLAYNSFAEEWGFTPVFTSPHFAQSNGHAERAVQTVKSILKKCLDENSNVSYALLQYRNTPLPDTGCSPARALMGRRLRTKLPVASTLLHPRIADPATIIGSKERSQQMQKYYYDRASEELSELEPQQPVWVKDNLADQEWQPAVVVEAGQNPRSFVIEKEEGGGKYVRNRRFLRPRIDLQKPARFRD